MLKHGEANPLAVFGLRRLEHCPPHFTNVDFTIECDEKTISDWIWSNLSGRFYYGDTYNETVGGKFIISKRAAFEMGSEASLFAMMLDTINKF